MRSGDDVDGGGGEESPVRWVVVMVTIVEELMVNSCHPHNHYHIKFHHHDRSTLVFPSHQLVQKFSSPPPAQKQCSGLFWNGWHKVGHSDPTSNVIK